MESLTELSLEEISSVNGGCSSIYDCAREAGKWVANRIEDAAEAVGGALEAWGDAAVESADAGDHID